MICNFFTPVLPIQLLSTHPPVIEVWEVTFLQISSLRKTESECWQIGSLIFVGLEACLCYRCCALREAGTVTCLGIKCVNMVFIWHKMVFFQQPGKRSGGCWRDGIKWGVVKWKQRRRRAKRERSPPRSHPRHSSPVFVTVVPMSRATVTNVPLAPRASGTDLSVSMTAAVDAGWLPATCTHHQSIDDVIQVQIRSRRRIMFPEKPLECW